MDVIDRDENEKDKFVANSKPPKDGRTWKPFWVRVRSEPEYRQQFLDSICMWAGFFVFGFVYGQPGPTLPDIRIITGVNLGTAAWFFTSFSVGYLVGCLVTGFIEQKINPRLFLFICIFGTAVFTTVTPWCKWFELMLAARVCMGLFVGGIDTGGHTFIFSIWRTDVHTYIQIQYFMFASGGLLVPLLTNPFLWKEGDLTDPTLCNNVTDQFINASCSNCSLSQNVTGYTYEDTPDANCSSLPVPGRLKTTRVHFSFLISGVLCFFASMMFLAMFIYKRNHRYPVEKSSEDESANKRRSKIKFVIAVVLLTLLFGVITGWIDSFAGFLMSFSILHLQWTKDDGSYATTMFWVAYAIGNFMCIFLVQCFRTGTLLFIYFMISILGLSGLIASAIYQASVPVWISVLLVGFSMSIMWPGVFTWTEKTVTPVTGKIASLFLVAGAVGFMVNPLATGYTMDNLTNMAYCYFHFGEAIFLTSIFVTVSLMYWKVVRKEEPKENRTEVEMDLIKSHDKSNLDGVIGD